MQLGLEEDQGYMLTFIAYLLAHSTLFDLPNAWAASKMLQISSEAPEFTLQLAFPNDQWEIEARRWFGISLARAQLNGVDSATAPEKATSIPNLLDLPGFTSTREFFRRSILIHSNLHVSVRVTDLLLSILATLCLWWLSSCDVVFSRFMFRRRPHAVLSWLLDSPHSLLQHLHKQLHENSGQQDSAEFAFRTLSVPSLRRVPGGQKIELVPAGATSDLMRIVGEMSGG